MAKAAFLRAPLCPAGHLPHLGGDWQFERRCSPCNVGDWRKRQLHLISPLEGEMAGRPEGGAVPPALP
ncbi:lytic murein transglycosylase [Mesorhizobium sp. M4A.F.Ca.ET.090.04.2.1]|nr:lytic murein transglycosylase [Mesorhizobium sp. M4A.F.Ca.ET.090.04.2.1]